MENVMLNLANDRIKIVDFGLSNIYNTDNPLRTHCGSPEYAAPELFIEGKHYGPEVDIWSLGVILYGMVVGQLPFVSNSREGACSHQQRRKRLLDQINKGLSTTHKKTLALFSSDFKAMMGKLLVADSYKRINISELIFHPWVTEKGRKSIRSNCLKKLDELSQINIMKEVASIIKMDLMEVRNAIRADPSGNIAGIYNIIVHSKLLRGCIDDTVLASLTARPRPISSKLSAEIHYLKPKSPIKRPALLKSAPIQKVSKLNPPIQSPRRLESAVKQVTSEKRIIVKPKLKSPSIKCNTGTNSAPVKLKSAQITTEEFNRATCDLNSLASSQTNEMPIKINTPVKDTITIKNEKLKNESNLVAQHFNLTTSPGGDGCTNNPTTFSAYDTIMYNISQQTRSKKTLTNEKIVDLAATLPQRTKSRTQSANVTSGNSSVKKISSQTLNVRRPLTTGPTHTAERAAKRRSMLPVMTKRNPIKNTATNTVVSPPIVIKNSRTAPEKRATLKIIDDFKKVTCPVKCQGHKLDFSNEPIARSIAGYVSKKISANKLEPVSKKSFLHQFKYIKD